MFTLPRPRSGWLLLGDERSFFSEAGLRRAVRDYTAGRRNCWSSSPRVELGDLLFIYFMAPRKAIHFICRAASRPYVDRKLFVRANREVSEYQWWVDITPPIPVEPIPFRAIRSAAGGYLNLRGRSGKFLDPSAANRLLRQAKVATPALPALIKPTLQPVTGRAELPDAATMSLRDWRDIPSSLLRLEREVEEYVVEPLLRFCGVARSGMEITPQFRTARGVPDYVLTSRGKPRAVIEVKQRIAAPRGVTGWRVSPHYRQVRAYARKLRCRSVLVDCDQVYLFAAPTTQFVNRFERRFMTTAHVEELRAFLVSAG